MKPCHARGIVTAIVFAASSVAQAHLLVPSQYPQIGQAIQAAAPGSVIEVSWQPGYYQPFVVDRPITIVGFGGQGQEPRVGVSAGVGVTFQLAAGQRATLARIDFQQLPNVPVTQGAVATGGVVAFEECRFEQFEDATGVSGLAVVDAVDTDLILTNCRIEASSGLPALRALRSRVHAVSSRMFGGSLLATPGVELNDSDLNTSACWLLGGEAFLAAPGAAALVVNGTSRAWLSDPVAQGGMGSPGASAIVNNTATPVEVLGGQIVGGLILTAPGTRAAATVGPVVNNARLLGLAFSGDPYRAGTLRPGAPFAASVVTAPGAVAMLAVSLAPSATLPVFTRAPAILPGEVVFALAVVAGPTGYATWLSSLPNVPGLIGTAVCMQGLGGSTFPFEVTPVGGLVVR